MITDKEKIDIIISRLDTIEFMIKSFIDNAEEFKNKYSLEDELSVCNAKKEALLQELDILGGVYQKS